jgi:hypothetical protein
MRKRVVFFFLITLFSLTLSQPANALTIPVATVKLADQENPILSQAAEQFLASVGSFIVHLLGNVHLRGNVHLGSITTVGSGASTTTWQTLKVGAGGYVRGLDVAPDGTMAGHTDTNGAYLWDASTSSWVQLVTATSMPAAFVAANPVSSGTGVFEIQIADSNTQIFYMIFDGYMWKSTNQGTTWTQQTSFNGGTQVTANANDSYGVVGQKMAIDPNNPNIVYAGSEGQGMFVTTNGGTSWTSVSVIPAGDDAGITGILFDPGASAGVVDGVTQTIFASSYGNGVYESTNGGTTWTLTSGGPTDVWYAAISSTGVYYATDGTNLWKFASGTWTELTSNGNGIAAIAVNPGNPNEIVSTTGSGAGLYVSYNGGATWAGGGPVSVSTPDIPWETEANTNQFGSGVWLSAGGLAFNPTDPNQLIQSAGTGVWNTTVPTSGFTSSTSVVWSDMSVGIENLVANEIIAPPGGTPILAAWDRPFFDITNLNEYPTSYAFPAPFGGGLTEGWSVDYASSNPSFIVGIADGAGEASPEESGYSTNGGETWTGFAFEPTDFNLTASATSTETSTTTEVLHFASLPSALHVGMSANDTTNSNAIAWYDYATVTSISGDNVTITFTASGQTITNTVSTGDIINFTLGDGGSIAASTPENILWAPANGTEPLYTLDGGTTWNPITVPGVTDWSGFDWAYYFNQKNVAADRVLANTFYLYYGAFYESTNGGQTWTETNNGSFTAYDYSGSIQSTPNEAGEVFFTDGIVGNGTDPSPGTNWQEFWRSTDQGTTWTALPNVTEVICFGYGMAAPGQTNPTMYIVGYVNDVFGIWRSTNATNPTVTTPTWVNLGTDPTGELDQITTISGDMNVYGQVYVGTAGGGYMYGTID